MSVLESDAVAESARRNGRRLEVLIRSHSNPCKSSARPLGHSKGKVPANPRENRPDAVIAHVAGFDEPRQNRLGRAILCRPACGGVVGFRLLLLLAGLVAAMTAFAP